MKTLFAIACLSVLSLAALPEMKVTTMNNAAINATQANRSGAGNCQSTNTYSHKYVPMQLTLTDPSDSRNNITVSSYADSIRGRGNSTWAIDKKPYRIKFGEHQSMFGATKKHKSWALLANWYDPTFALNAVGFELGKRLGLPGTPNHFLVDFYLNNTYKGIYQVTDIVQVNKGRVDVDTAAGWLVEFDYHCPSDADEVDFNTNYPNNPQDARLHTFIKSPEKNYQFVKDEVNALTNAMFQTQGFPTNGYRDLIDLESMAKYVMIQQLMDNFDFNNKAMAAGSAIGGSTVAMPGSNFMHKDKGKKMVAGPLWDLDLAAGVDNQQNFPKHYQYYNYPIKPKHPFYAKFFDDPVFLAKWKKTWDKYLNDFKDMTRVMDSIATYAEGSVEKNFALQNGGGAPCTSPWGCGGGGFGMNPEAPATKQAYKDEVGKLKTWWNNRINFFQQEMNKMNIDICKDIDDPCVNSSSSANSGGNTDCAFQASWCNNSTPANNTTSKPQNGQCVFVKDYSSLITSGSGGTILINGTQCTGNGTNCANSKPAPADGGYYIYVQSGISSNDANYVVTAGLPTCGTTPLLPLAISLQSQPGAKMEVYNLQGKLVYSGYPENPKILKILVQTKGVYIVRYGKTQRMMVVK